MKSIFFVLAIILLSSAQTDIEFPALSSFQGNWYVVWNYAAYINNSYNPEINCLEVFVNITSANGGHMNQTITEPDGHTNTDDDGSFTVGSSPNIWNIEGNDFVWFSYDPVNLNWGTMVNQTTQWAAIFSRTPQISSAVFASNVALLKAKGYAINATNAYTFPGNLCPSS